MDALATVLAILGVILFLGGEIWFLVVAFQKSVWWGLGCIFLPFVSLIFLVMYWKEAVWPFLVSLAGSALIIPMMLHILPGLFK